MKPSELRTLCVSQIASALIIKNMDKSPSLVGYVGQAEALYDLIHQRAKEHCLKQKDFDDTP